MDEDRYEHVLRGLGVIARLTENKRLSIRTGQVDIDNSDKFQFLRRWWNDEDRDVCLSRVRQIFNEAINMARGTLHDIMHISHPSSSFDEVNQYLEKERCVRKYGRLSQALEGAANGIQTHLVTYKKDDGFCTSVEVLVGQVRDALHDMDMTLKATKR